MIFKKRQKRQVRRASDPNYSAADYYSSDTTSLSPPKRKRRGWRVVLTIVILLLLAGAIAAAVAYLYVGSTVLKGEREGRINLLLMGVDDTATLSDTIMLASIDTRHGEAQKVALVSIPRDMYVKIPEFGSEKINAAYTFGQNNDYPGGGPALTEATLTPIIDQPIHYYVAMDFTGFRQLVDAAGGIDVEVKQDIDDPYYPDYRYGYSRFRIKAGLQHMDGETALRYARSRYTTSDFDRAARQQQIVLAFRQKVISAGTLLDKNKVDQIQQALKDHLKTDLSLRESAKLADILRKIPDDRTTRHVIDSSNYLEASQRYGYGLVPHDGFGEYDEIQAFIANIFNETTNTIPLQQQ